MSHFTELPSALFVFKRYVYQFNNPYLCNFVWQKSGLPLLETRSSAIAVIAVRLKQLLRDIYFNATRIHCDRSVSTCE